MNGLKYVLLLPGFLACGCGTAAAPDGKAPEASASSPASATSPATPDMPKYPDPDTWQHAGPRQKERARRSFAELKKRSVPAYPGPLFVEDDEEVKVQSAQDVARRTLVLWAVELRAEGMPQAEARGILDKMKLWDYVSPDEKRFLDDKNPSPEESQKLVWRLESLWVLMWSLGYLDELPWPSGMCDVKKVATLLIKYENDPKFISGAKLRPTRELLDAQDLILRTHWAIRNAWLKDGMIPEDLDWSTGHELVPVTRCPGVGVIEQRHHTINWLLKFMDPESWDVVDTPT